MAKAKRTQESTARAGESATERIDQRIRDLAGWRGETLGRMRTLILAAVPAMTEEWKWGTPVWSQQGIVCTGEAYAQVVKLTFAKGAALPDPAGLFNASLTGNTRRAIDIRAGDSVDARAFKALVKAAVAHNVESATSRKAQKKKKTTGKKPTKKPSPAAQDARRQEPRESRAARKVVLLSGGNPQIAKADGDAPVQAYIAALPGWKRALGERLDALIARNVPELHKAVKWNSPLYGVAGRDWFLSLHAFTRYVKVAFFRGTSLKPVPPGPSKDPETRYLDIREDDAFDEEQFAQWVRQAAALPGRDPGRSS